MITKRALLKILENILKKSDLSEEIEEGITKIKKDFEEKEEVLKIFGSVYDGEDKEEYDYISSYNPEDIQFYKDEAEKYKDMYTKRFFGVDTEILKKIDKENEEDVKKDEHPQTFDELLSKD